CLRVGDHLLVGDQVLDPITPNIPPQSITPFTGLENYINGLVRLRKVEGITVALPAHAEVITDLGARIDAILDHHRARLDAALAGAEAPATVAQIAEVLYGQREGYDVLLAILEAGAHVEYLNEMGRLRIANLDEVQAERDPVMRYEASS
ncbi:MAG: MBL fold metallo-hydrolase, partial [Deltaproteobacteria bacterium]